MKKQKINGLVRFSLMNLLGNHDVFAPEYFEYRLNLFIKITLRSLQEQTDKGFNVFLYHSDQMPGKYRKIFDKLEKENNFLHNIYQKGVDIVAPPQDALDFSDGACVTFRVDNDDGLPRDFIARIRKYANKEFAGMAISIPEIIKVRRVAKCAFRAERKNYIANSIGLAYVSGPDQFKTIWDMGSHVRVRNKNEMILVPGLGGLMTISGNNIGNTIYKNKSERLDFCAASKLMVDNNHADYDFDCLSVLPDWKYSVVRLMRHIRRIIFPNKTFTH